MMTIAFPFCAPPIRSTARAVVRVNSSMLPRVPGPMARYFNNRLKQVFVGVAEEPGVLWNSSKNPLYMFCFAVGNERGKDIALRIANHLLKPLKEVR